ncbi:sulfite exporter TauE/SafE family protein [Flavicella sediminum]|uniref:sulfite exporter TauE/SafE family protein n=1 Tax=Flavicella sediminum TaxID=2585141 RepID=UPI0011241AFC|nr:sulfite exporter TauE/SafE family protein [Flavicella sediminum]
MYSTALLLGLLGSLHCVGMCGPIALVLPVHKSSTLQKLLKITLYHIGRITAYGSIGVLFGLLGKGLYLAGFQQRLSIILGVIMVGSVLIPTQFLEKFQISKPLYLFINKLKSGLGKQLKRKSNKALFTIGFLNGFLPCGMVYMALIGALATVNPTQGFIYMAVYGLGTIPLMTLVIYSKSIFSIQFRNRAQKAIPVFVVLIGALFILRGFGIGIPYISPSNAALQIGTTAVPCATPPQ